MMSSANKYTEKYTLEMHLGNTLEKYIKEKNLRNTLKKKNIEEIQFTKR